MKPVPNSFCRWGGGGVRWNEMLVLFLFSLSNPQFLIYLLQCTRFTVLCQFQVAAQWFSYPSIFLFVCVSIFLSFCLNFYLSVSLYFYLFVFLSIFLSTCVSTVFLSVSLSICLPIYPFSYSFPLPVSWSCVLKGRCRDDSV